VTAAASCHDYDFVRLYAGGCEELESTHPNNS